ncbi:MAG: roadblock/LC7 domain-containing protein, partial [Candidatus Obscuribacterales bacterium]|nr:roadblock/LC7 domain-containing protein [Candidatus Obscuribacterales bacterium]
SLFAEETQAAGSVPSKRAPEQLPTFKEESQAVQAEAEAPSAEEEVPAALKPEEVPAELKPEEAPQAPAASPAEEAAGRLFGDVSNDIEDIFGSLVGDEAQKDFAPAESPAAEKAVEAAPEAAAPAGGLLNVTDNDVSDLFDNLLADEPKTEAPAPEPSPEPAPQAPPPAAPAAPEATQSFGPKMGESGSSAKTAVKEFGKLSATAAAKPEQSAGTLKTIGQMLLDTGAVERIIKSAEKGEGGSKWKVLTVDRGADLQALMDKLASFPGVESALLMGKDGLLLSNTESLSAMKYVFGPLSLAMHSTTNLGTAKLQMGELRQAILKSGDKVNIMVDVGSAILAVFGEWNPSTLDRLMAHINAAVTGQDTELPTEDEAPDLSAQPQAAAPEPVAAPPAEASGVVNVSDNEMSDIFDNLLSEDSQDKKKEEEAAPAAAPQAAPAAGGLLNVSDKEVGDLFDNLLGEDAGEKKSMDFSPAEAQKQEAAAAAESAPVAEEKPPESKKDKKDKKKQDSKPPQQMKEFGKLSVQASKQDAGGAEGAMKAIGRQLIDVQAVENIIKAGEKREKIGSGLTTARVISAARGEGIKTLLSKVDTYEGVIGSLIVGHDGMVIASTLQGGVDKDVMGALCTAIHSHLDVASKKMEKGKLQQAVFVCNDNKLTVMTAVAVGILAVFVDNAGVEKVDGLLNAIETTVKG